MNRLNVLIVEDDLLIAMDLEDFVSEICPAVATIRPSVSSAKKVLYQPFDFGFLDINVADGQSFEVGQILARKNIPFALVSGTRPRDLPGELRNAPFIQKPFRRSQIEQVLKEGLLRNGDSDLLQRRARG